MRGRWFLHLPILIAVAGPATAGDSGIGYNEIKAATEETARQMRPAPPIVKAPEPPRTERPPVNQSFGWEGGLPIAPGRTPETPEERESARDRAEQRFLTPRVPHAAAPTPAESPAIAAPVKPVAAPAAAAASPPAPVEGAAEMARALADQLRARKADAPGSVRIVLDQISASGEALAGTAIDTGKP
jgi:hypothetical protein